MSTAEIIAEQVKRLPADKQQRVLEFVRSLEQRRPSGKRRNLYGILKDIGPDMTEEGIARARKEMWGNFPRDDF